MSELPSQPGRIILRCDEANAWMDGYAFLEQARCRADDLNAATDKAVEQARAEGYEAGRSQGAAEAAALITQTTGQIEHYYAGLDQKLTDLSLQIIRRIFSDFDDSDLVARCAANALREVRDDMAVIIRVAPEQLAGVETALADIAVDEQSRIQRIEADPGLSATQCLFVSPAAVIDVGLDSQLDSLRSALLRPTGNAA